MKPLKVAAGLTDQVREAILSDIASGQLQSGERIVQEQLAEQLGVSRHPVQQALTLLRREGVLSDAPGRGLQVAPLDLDHVRHLYEMRAVIEGLAFRKAAQRNAAQASAKGPALIRTGRKAVGNGSYSGMIAADMAFHNFIYRLSGNPLIPPAMERHWTDAQRVMGEVLMRGDKPRDIWDQHEALLEAVTHGEAERAESLARSHIIEAAEFMIAQLERDRALGMAKTQI